MDPSSGSFSTPAKVDLRRSTRLLKVSPDSVVDSNTTVTKFSYETSLRWCGSKRDPLIAIYLPAGSNQAQRNLVFRAFIYASRDTESKVPLEPAEVDAALLQVPYANLQEPDNCTAAQPFEQRLSGPRALCRFVGYIQERKNTVWPALSVDAKLFLAVMPGGDYHPIV